jgi:hypothetical protein
MEAAPKFAGGRNIAMKVPPHLWDATVRFYRDVGGELGHLTFEHIVSGPARPA